ncbi:MAG: manganese-binding transcriptional regulator MntR [Verrucomicrobia bacterium]|nr:manganese-binding transcriptional regulator MntR [Verrucomicrobiota bacterium]
MPAKSPRPKKTTRKRVAPATRAESFRKVRSANAAETAQDYAEAIAELIENDGEARPTDLARMFGVSHVTVIRTVARLQRDGLLITRPYRSIFLTPKGAALAAECRERHALVVAFLLALGVPRAAAEGDAEGIEHHLGAETIAAFRAFLRRSK